MPAIKENIYNPQEKNENPQRYDKIFCDGSTSTASTRKLFPHE